MIKNCGSVVATQIAVAVCMLGKILDKAFGFVAGFRCLRSVVVGKARATGFE